MDVRVHVLGEFEVEGFGAGQLGSRKARTLLKVLALARGKPVTVDHLIDCLWPEDEAAPSRPDEQVSVLVSRLRAVLGSERLPRTLPLKLFEWISCFGCHENLAFNVPRASSPWLYVMLSPSRACGTPA